jgi:uncharacterized protein (UPF0332 family)
LHFIKTGKVNEEYHKHLNRASQLRHEADYMSELPPHADQAAEQLKRAEAFIAMGKQYLTPTTGDKANG